MTVFVDTSAWYALVAADDVNHTTAARILESLAASREPLVTHNYVLVETLALAQHRLGMTTVRRLLADLFPLANIEWIQPSLHDVAAAAFQEGSLATSLVDHVSFALLTARGIGDVFAFDDDFAKRGFSTMGV